MRDLSCFEPDSFEIVWHAHSLNFVPDAAEVFDQVVRVLRPGGQYRLNCWNPFAHGVCEKSWNGQGYTLARAYIEGERVEDYEFWEVLPWDRNSPSEQESAAQIGTQKKVRIQGPKEFRHTLSTLVNGLIERQFALLGLWEDDFGNPDAEPGTWAHVNAYAPPWLVIWARKTVKVATPDGACARPPGNGQPLPP